MEMFKFLKSGHTGIDERITLLYKADLDQLHDTVDDLEDNVWKKISQLKDIIAKKQEAIEEEEETQRVEYRKLKLMVKEIRRMDSTSKMKSTYDLLQPSDIQCSDIPQHLLSPVSCPPSLLGVLEGDDSPQQQPGKLSQHLQAPGLEVGCVPHNLSDQISSNLPVNIGLSDSVISEQLPWYLTPLHATSVEGISKHLEGYVPPPAVEPDALLGL